MPPKILALFVLYNPEEQVLINSVQSVIAQVNGILLIDNSEVNHMLTISELLKDIKFNYIWNETNIGIASALNIGFKKAIEENYDWVLCMDQDSIIDPNTINVYLNFILQESSLNIGALMPSFTLCINALKVIGDQNREEYDYMTSGSLVSTKAYQESGGFDDKLFIDMVDTDFGFKLILKGYKILRISDILMHHNIGNAYEVSIKGHPLFYVTNHNYLRRYYITRNILYIHKVYGRQFKVYASPSFSIFKSIVRIILFEKDKIRKLISIKKGIVDYKNNRYGKYQE